MWLPNQKNRLRATAIEIVQGLRYGALVPDPPLGKDVGEAFDFAKGEVAGLSWVPQATAAIDSLGVYESYAPVRGAALPRPQRKSVSRASDGGVGNEGASGSPGQQVFRHAVL